MADFNQINQFGSAKPSRSGAGMSCTECEAMLTDFIDGTLTPKDRAAFDLHIATCKECSQMLADAQRGAALLEMLKSPRPEPPSSLIDRIISQTSGQTSGQASGQTSAVAVLAAAPSAGVLGLSGVTGLSVIDGGASAAQTIAPGDLPGIVALPAAAASNVLPFRSRTIGKFSLQAITRTMMQPRLAMTAAMAFFSIALTMNLTGVHISELKASDLKPSNIRHTFYQADASLVRYYDNLRVVYELETRVSDLKQSNDSDGPQPTGKSQFHSDSGKDSSGSGKDQKQKQTPKAGSGTSQRRSPLLQEFKLADEQFDQHADRTSSVALLDRSVLDRFALRSQTGRNTNKLKEMLQEGELV